MYFDFDKFEFEVINIVSIHSTFTRVLLETQMKKNFHFDEIEFLTYIIAKYKDHLIFKLKTQKLKNNPRRPIDGNLTQQICRDNYLEIKKETPKPPKPEPYFH